MRAHYQYFKYVLRHKWFVFWAALHLGVPFWIALIHDWDKFFPDEWFPYVRTFYKPNGEKQYVKSVEFARAWMLHQHRNKHHWQYWLWVNIPTHNCALRLPETDYLMWDSGLAQRVVNRSEHGTNWYELQSPCFGDEVCCPDPMPDVYRREMLADWIGAGKATGKPNTWEWYAKNKNAILLHEETREWVERELDTLHKEFGNIRKTLAEAAKRGTKVETTTSSAAD